MKLSLPVTGLGLVTSVGVGVVPSCAALRAGLSRPSEQPDLVVEEPEMMETPVFVHQASPLTDGFVQTGRWLQLAHACIVDVIRDAEVAPSFWNSTELLVVVPEIDRARFGWPEDDMEAIVKECFVEPLLELAEIAPSWRRGGFFHGHCGFAAALSAAQRSLQKGGIDRVLLLSVDSYVDPLCLSAIADASRLKAPMGPVGLVPGEAAACVMVERETTAANRRARIQGWIRATHHEPPPSTTAVVLGSAASPAHERARRLSGAAAIALKDAQPSMSFAGDIILDLNGEEWKALSWGMAQSALQDRIDFSMCRAVLPCGSFGEIGSASAGAGVCVAVRSYERGYASGDSTLILSLGERGDAAAVLMSAR